MADRKRGRECAGERKVERKRERVKKKKEEKGES